MDTNSFQMHYQFAWLHNKANGTFQRMTRKKNLSLKKYALTLKTPDL